MGGKHSRDKGIRGELEVVKLMSRWFPDCHRASECQRSSTVHVPDIIGGGIEDHFYIEVKRYKNIHKHQLLVWTEKVNSDIVEAKKHNDYELGSIIVYRVDGESWRVLLYATLAERLGLIRLGMIVGGVDYIDKDSDRYIYEWQDFADALDKRFEVKDGTV